MRLDRVYIDGFKNLKDFEIDFDETRLTSVVIGQNGTGKSNLIEAIVEIFRYIDLNKDAPKYKFEIEYRINGLNIRVSNRTGKTLIFVDGNQIGRKYFDLEKDNIFPDLVFGYYSGDSRKLESLFDEHQKRYYDVISKDQSTGNLEYDRALNDRRLFYCRQTHGVMALLSIFAFPEEKISTILKDKLGITGFHSALALLKKPYWFSTNSSNRENVTNKAEAALVNTDFASLFSILFESTIQSIPGAATLSAVLSNMSADKLREIAPLAVWGAAGPSGKCGQALIQSAFHPITTTSDIKQSYRGDTTTESQIACFIKSKEGLSNFSKNFRSDQLMFSAFEAMDISDLIRELTVWVTRVEDDTGDVSFSDLSDGERQLLMVLGLIRASRGKKALFLLDEPDTHLNPAWQHSFLSLIQDWVGAAAEVEDCQVILTSHNPLTIAALETRDVRILHSDEVGQVSASPPYTDPRGMGFTATLTEIFGLPTTLDPETQSKINLRDELSLIAERSEEQNQKLDELNQTLNRLGFMFENRDPMYYDFLRAVSDYKYSKRPLLSPEELKVRRLAMSKVIEELLADQETKH